MSGIRVVHELELDQVHHFLGGLHLDDLSQVEGDLLLHVTFFQRVHDVELQVCVSGRESTCYR